MKKLSFILALALFAASSSFSQLVNAGPPQHGQDKKTAKPRGKPMKKPSKQECDKYRFDEYEGLYYNEKKVSSIFDVGLLCDDLKGFAEYRRKRVSDSLYWEQRVVEVGRKQAEKEYYDKFKKRHR